MKKLRTEIRTWRIEQKTKKLRRAVQRIFGNRNVVLRWNGKPAPGYQEDVVVAPDTHDLQMLRNPRYWIVTAMIDGEPSGNPVPLERFFGRSGTATSFDEVFERFFRRLLPKM